MDRSLPRGSGDGYVWTDGCQNFPTRSSSTASNWTEYASSWTRITRQRARRAAREYIATGQPRRCLQWDIG